MKVFVSLIVKKVTMIKKQHLDLKSEPNLGREKVKSDRKKRKRNLDLGQKLKGAPPKNRCKIIDHADAFLNISVAFLRSKPRFCLNFSLFKIESTFYARYQHLFSQNQGLYFTFNRLNFFKLLRSPLNFFAFDELLFS